MTTSYDFEKLNDSSFHINKSKYYIYTFFALVVIFECFCLLVLINGHHFNDSFTVQDSIQTSADKYDINKICPSRKKGSYILSYGPGDYILRPQDYYCVDYLILEIWGGSCSGDENIASLCETGSAAHIKGNIKPRLQNIIIHVGTGGTTAVNWTYFSNWRYAGLYCNTIFNQTYWISISNDLNSTVSDIYPNSECRQTTYNLTKGSYGMVRIYFSV